MNRNRPLFPALLLAGVALLAATPRFPAAAAPAEEEPGTVKALRTENTEFALRLYGRLAEDDGNIFLSPHSISTALAMTWAGARGRTEREMAGTLCFTMGQAKTHAAFAELLHGLDRAGDTGSVTLLTANALWPQQGFEFAKPFLDTVRGHYDAELQALDFAGATEQARRRINDWVEQKTDDRIRGLIKPGVLNAATRLVLTNAVYFKGKWQAPFDAGETADLPFALPTGTPADVPTMRIEERFAYGEAPGLQLVRLPYGTGELSMVVLLPESTGGLPDLEHGLTAARLDGWLGGMRHQEVFVSLPRFRMESQFRLDGVLSGMGMGSAFDSSADFSGMAGKPLFLSAVVHQAFVEVNEEGTEAAAATGAVMQLTSVPAPAKNFRADHPFIFIIMGPADEVLFIGRVTDPR